MYHFELAVNELNMLLICIAVLCLGILFLRIYKQIQFYKKDTGEFIVFEDIYDKADQALYEAKNAGRDCCLLYSVQNYTDVLNEKA